MNAANQRNSTPKWSDVANDQDFQSADWETRQKVRGEFYRRVVEPETPAELREEVQGKFFTQTEPDVFGERDSSADSERFSYPGAAADQSALDERQQNETGLRASQQNNEEEAPGLASNALRNAGERGLDLAGNAVQFVGNMAEMGEKLITDHLGGLNPGVIGGESDAMRERGYEPDMELGGYGLDFTARAKPEDTDTGMTGAGQAVEDVRLGYQPNYTIDRALDNPSVETLAGAAAEQGPAALADMAGLAINLPAYLASRTQEIGESRAQNEGRDGMPEGGDYAVAGPTAAASVLLDRFALGRLLPGGKGAVSKASQVPGAVGRATATEATTEAVQEGGIEYAGESLGTEQGWDPVTAGRRAAGGAIVGGPTGGAVRAGTAAAEVAGGRASVAEDESGQADNSPEEESSPETQQANEEAVGAAAELIRRPRFELSSSEREVRDSITYGDAFKSLRAAAEAQGDTEAVAELDAVSEEVSSALEDETLARSSGEEDAIEPIRQRLDGAAQRFTSTMERINSQRSDSQSPENDIERAAAETDTEPTPAQAEAGNYRKGKVRLNGFEIAIENPKGSTRRGTAQDGTEWESQMAHHYGDIKGTTAADGDNLDVFVGDNPSSPQAYVIDQVNEDGGFDEHKVMLGFDSLEDARQGYLANYEDGWKGLGEISETSVDDFRQWVREGNTRAPFAMPDTQTKDDDVAPDDETAGQQRETTYLSDNTPVDTRFRVVDMADLTPSNRADGKVNPNFPAELQPRDRANANSRVQVRNIAARLNPERLGSSPDAGTGAPIIGEDGVVESGNGRAMAIATAYRQGGERAEAYRDFVRSQAQERGIDADFDSMRRPMLVRERASAMDRADFARRANESQVAGMTSYEQAQADADAMTADDVQAWSPDQSGDPLAASNRDFQRAFVSRLGNNEASRYTTRQGQAAPELGQRMSRAVFAKAYADPDMVELITEQGDQMRNLSSALQSAAPDLAMARETGSQDALDTIATINDAVRLVRASRRDGAPIRELVSQADAFSEPTSELTADLAILVNTNMRSRASLEQALGFVAQDARRRAESARNGALFEDATTSEDAIREGFRQAPAEDTDGQRAPEDDVPGRPDESEQEPSQRREADPSEGAAEAQEVSDSPLLESYTEQDVAEREQAAQKAQEEETRTRREDEQRAAADREADDFALSGSSLPADQANARGQDPLFAFAGEGAQNADPAASEPVSAPRAEAIRARLSEHPELSGVEVVQSARELPTQVQLVMAMQGVEASDVSGVYNPDTGAPMIVADNLIDEADGVRKAVHEGVGHYGIRGMLGEELEPLMLEIYQSHTRSNSGRQNIEEIQQTYPFIDVATRKGKITLAEELVAHYIEDSNGRPKLRQRIMSTIRRLLRKLFPGIQWRTSDILAMGDQARRWLRRQQAARDVGDPRFAMSSRDNSIPAKNVMTESKLELNPPDEETVRLFHAGSDPAEGGFFETVPSGGAFNKFDGFFALQGGWGNYGSGAKYFADIKEEKILSQRDLDYEIPYEEQISALKKSMPWVDEDDIDLAYEAVVEDSSESVDPDELMRVMKEDGFAEASWEAQRIRGQVTRNLGYEAVEMADENGTSYLILSGAPLTRVVEDDGDSTASSNPDIRYSFADQQEELSAQDLAAQLREEYPGLKLDMASRGQKATISRIVAPEREQGTGSAVMRRLTDWADASGRTLALTPSSDFGGSVKRLHEFYRRFGFMENKGRNKDYEISEAMYREPDHGVGDVRFSLTQQPGTVGGKYSSTDSTGFSMPDESLRDAALRKMADKMRPLKILEDAIRRTGQDIEEEADAYLAEELFHGKVEHDLRQLREQHVEPLAEGLAKAKIGQAELDDYLYARHAPERNATIAERNPDNPEMQDGGSGMTNAQAAEIIERVASSGKQEEYDRLAQIVYDMTRLRREAIREGGLEDDAMIDAWEANWQNYVPLKGNAADDPGRPRTGRGFEVSGRESRIAGGRNTLADSPSSQVIVDVNESLIRRRKNEVAQSFLSLVTDNPNPSLWEVFTDDNPDTQRTPTRITDPETEQVRIEVQERPVNMAGNDRYFKAKRAGRTYYLKIHDERLMNAMRNVGPENNNVLIRASGAVTRVMSSLVTSYNPEFMLTNFTRDVQTALLNLSAEQTRDDGKIKGEAIVRQTARDIAPSMRAAWRGLRGKTGKNDGSREWDKWFREFQEDGAKTGYFDMKDLNAQAKEIQSMIRRADGTTLSHMLKARKKTADFVENMNGAVENAVRLSAYANARRAGVSRKKAASLAKNMTVNFNRRGEAGTALNAAYMFANASIQGTMNFARTMVTVKNAPEGKSQMNVWARMNTAQKLGLGMATGAFMLGMLNRWLSDEDEDGVLFYDKIPDYEKERNIILMTGWMGEDPEDYIKLPLPYGYNVFSVVGTHAEAVAAGTEEPTEAAKNIVLAVAGSFSPIGFEDSDEAQSLFLKNLTPTIFRSITQVGVNENFAGSPIYREDFPFGTPTPDSSRAFRSTPEAYKDFAQFLNSWGGSEYRTGNIDINPDVMQHIVNYYGGGAWGFVEKSADFAKRAITGEEVDRYRVPFAGRFMGDVSPYPDQNLFYERMDELGQRANEAEALRGRERVEFRRDNIERIRLYNRGTNIRQQLTDLRKRRDRVKEAESLSDDAKKRRTEMIEKQMKKRIDDFNRRYNDLKED
ncbi:LPD38 domain-containing protein [Chromohalobacter sp. HP20-39]|uniref:LPD38 domain-containing protein n=1 Tax=Chromohalobacter sp. HP20-39 TaxID=3079306 RepID=UPI00294AE20C|nr:LPD38 domain-containing protein [Chromohalobacter sp. HP20-39]MDV6318823.1 LPD38 domain-containing protein [Chromohalobacter sp. HP20-39]